jgi:hypothetical protein
MGHKGGVGSPAMKAKAHTLHPQIAALAGIIGIFGMKIKNSLEALNSSKRISGLAQISSAIAVKWDW